MEFLKALELAKEQGLSNQEFIAVWEAEAKMSLKREEAKMMELKTAGTPQIPQLDTAMAFKTEMNGLPEFRTETLTQELRNQMHWQKEELKEQFEQKFQSIHNHLAESQEEHWQQTLQNHNTALEEIRQHFMVMFGHVTTTVESQINALKLYFMQEMELMKQDLVGKIHALIEEKGVEHAHPGASKTDGTKGVKAQPACASKGLTLEQFQQVQLKTQEMVKLQQQQQQQKDNVQHQQQKVKPLPQQLQETKLQQQKQPQLQQMQSEQPIQQHPNSKAPQQQPSPQPQQNQQHNVQQLTSQSQQRNGRSDNRVAQSIPHCDPPTSYAAIAAHKTGPSTAAHTQNVPSSHEALENSSDTSLPRPGSECPSSPKSVEGTGFFADVISSRMKQRGTSPASSLGSRSKSSVSSRGEAKSPRDKSQQIRSNSSVRTVSSSSAVSSSGGVVRYLPVLEARFKIDHSDDFSAKKAKLTTQFYYTSSNACKIRIGVFFNEKQQLNIHLLVSNSSVDNSQKWPILFSGKGSVYNKTSDRFTPIWEFPSVKISKPASGTEVSLPAKVCLSTLRGSHPDITYEKLVLKGYAADNCLQFLWNLNVDEKPILPMRSVLIPNSTNS